MDWLHWPLHKCYVCDSILRHQFCEVAKNGDDPQEDIAKNGDDPQEHIAKFGNKIHMKVNFDQNLAIGKSQEVLDFSTF